MQAAGPSLSVKTKLGAPYAGFACGLLGRSFFHLLLVPVSKRVPLEKRVISDQEAGEEQSLSALRLCRGSAHRYQNIISDQ